MKEIKSYIAHTVNNKGMEQSMIDHSYGVANLMSSFALSPLFADLYAYCGLMHDLGKYQEHFQNYLRNKCDSVPHSIWGAYAASQNKLINIAHPIIGHHGGLKNNDEVHETLSLCNNDDFQKIYSCFIEDNGSITLPNNYTFNQIPTITQKELFVRLLYSSLVDADSLDTERHFNLEQYDSRPNSILDVDNLLVLLNKKFAKFTSNSDINRLRNDVRLYAQQQAKLPQGCFSMTLPTGLGKTLCSINWALHHAKAHKNIKRIIIVLPFISIIDQTSKVLKDIFGDSDVVLEHHSNVIHEPTTSNGEERISPRQLATENWNYPIIVTTSVQFFESLFSNKRSKCRKLHNIQDSIIIFDEIQTIPLGLAECSMVMLNDVLQLCRSSLLLCTATQPDFKTRKEFQGIDNITSLVENPKCIFEQTKRVEYIPVDSYLPQDSCTIAARIAEDGNSTMVICNTKKKALAMFDALKEKSKLRVLHLSTNMCPIHRLEIIVDIKDTLKRGERLIVCSTQLIEAGVDLDFPVVYRELAPLESIIQSAGRCNREGKLEHYGQVYLFSLAEKGQPNKQYQTFADFARTSYKGNESRLCDADFYTEYYRDIIRLYGPKDSITADRNKLMFQTVAEKYRLIDNETTTLFIYKYNEDSLNLYHSLKDQEYLSRSDCQQVSQYSVQIYDIFLKDNYNLIGDMAGIKVWYGGYDEYIGLTNEEEFYYI